MSADEKEPYFDGKFNHVCVCAI